MYSLLETSLSEWIDVIYLAGDSEISLAWTIYESNKLDVFTRNRVTNIRSKVPLSQLHHVQGAFNLADLGTRPSVVEAKDISPNSEWICGKDWMKQPYEDVLNQGILKKVSDIKLDNDAKKVLKEGLIDDFYEKEVRGFMVHVNKSDAENIVQCELKSNCMCSSSREEVQTW